MEEKLELKKNKMGTKSIGRLLASMAWPAILSMTINALYNIVDSIFVARLSEDALTAVSLMLPIHLLLVSLGVGTGIGINSLISRRLGEKEFEKANQAASTGIRLAFWGYLVFALIGLFFTEKFVGLYVSDGPVYENGVIYLKYISLGAIFILTQMITEKLLQATGNMIAPMIISMTGAIINIILDPILIFGLLGAPRLEISGAAIATLTGQFCAMSVGLIILLKKNHAVKIKLKGFKYDWETIKGIYAVALPTILMQSIGSIMILGYNSILASSVTAVAVIGVYFRLQSFIFMPVFGLTQGALPIMGYNYGAQNKERLVETYKKTLMGAVFIMTIGFALFQLIPETLLGMFSAKGEMLTMGIKALRIISICFIPAAYGIVSSVLFQATGNGIYSLFSALIRQLIGILPMAYFLNELGGVNMTWYAFPLAEILGTIYCTIMLRHLYKKVIQPMTIENI